MQTAAPAPPPRQSENPSLVGRKPARPLIAGRAPHLCVLPPGEYLWCACGRSRSQPFCDGAHAGTGFEPVRFTVTRRSGLLWLCSCKHSRDKPHCDGSHNRLGR